tara:strand:- start:44 stop:802 length:759 start_codon:yes stop_codon:yes gene_type:complete
MVLNGSLAFTYPYSKLLGGRPCGKVPTSKEWVSYGANPNIPVYKNAPYENCGTEKSCTPQLRFKDGDNNLVISRKELRQANNRKMRIDSNGVVVTPVNLSIFNSPNYTGPNPPVGNIGAQTPFRALMNAGDPNVSVNKYPAPSVASWVAVGEKNVDPIYVNPPNQVSSTRRASNAAAVRMSGYMPTNVASRATAPSGGGATAAWSGNSKWVYDGTDYIRFKKLQAKNRNFNDISWGGDRNNASQVALARVRH